LTRSRLLVPRVVGALLLRARTYRDVADDESAGVQAGLVIVLVGMIEATVLSTAHGQPALGSEQMIYSVLAALIGWLVWSAIVFVISARVFDYPLDFRAVTRAVAFAHTPALVYGVAAVTPFTEWRGLALVASLLWFAGALVACVEGLLRVPTSRALAITAAALVTHEVIHQALRLAGLMA
jgi:Yip1 domain